jgi:hypothetical protein
MKQTHGGSIAPVCNESVFLYGANAIVPLPDRRIDRNIEHGQILTFSASVRSWP